MLPIAPWWIADAGAVCGAAVLAASIHLYQGVRGALIVAQLPVLFGVLYLLSGSNLWAVVLCHGLYDTIAFVRFAAGKVETRTRMSAAEVSERAHDPLTRTNVKPE